MKQTTTLNKPSFLKDWTPAIFTKMQKRISAHFSGKPMSTTHGNYPEMYLSWTAVSDRLGLAYTSSSSYAGYWICNTEVYHDEYPGYKYIGFAMANRRPVAILWDKDEKELIITL